MLTYRALMITCFICVFFYTHNCLVFVLVLCNKHQKPFGPLCIHGISVSILFTTRTHSTGLLVFIILRSTTQLAHLSQAIMHHLRCFITFVTFVTFVTFTLAALSRIFSFSRTLVSPRTSIRVTSRTRTFTAASTRVTTLAGAAAAPRRASVIIYGIRHGQRHHHALHRAWCR